MNGVPRRAVSELVGLTEFESSFDASTRHPDGKRLVVVSTHFRPIFPLQHWCPPELGSPDHECRVKKPTLLEISDERRSTTSGLLAKAWQSLLEVESPTVEVPLSVVDLHKAHATFDQSASEQAVIGEMSAPGCVP